jgi:VanZ family protein
MINQTSKDFIARWIGVIVWLSFIFFMSTGAFSAENTFSVVRIVVSFLFPRLSTEHVMLVHAIIRKTAHIFEYFILSLLLLRAFCGGSPGVWKWRWSLLAMTGVVLWALGDEFHQAFVLTRTGSMVDVGIDAAGGILAQSVGALWYRYANHSPGEH